MHRLDLGLYSHPEEFVGVESEPMLTPREKIPFTGDSEDVQFLKVDGCPS